MKPVSALKGVRFVSQTADERRALNNQRRKGNVVSLYLRNFAHFIFNFIAHLYNSQLKLIAFHLNENVKVLYSCNKCIDLYDKRPKTKAVN